MDSHFLVRSAELFVYFLNVYYSVRALGADVDFLSEVVPNF
jgi:hypothetical protein